jgi:hypothetical protein
MNENRKDLYRITKLGEGHILCSTGLGLGLWSLTPFSTVDHIVVVSFIGGGNRSARRKSPICRKSLTNVITKCSIGYASPWAGFELTTLVVIDTDCRGSYNPTTIRSRLRRPRICLSEENIRHNNNYITKEL